MGGDGFEQPVKHDIKVVLMAIASAIVLDMGACSDSGMYGMENEIGFHPIVLSTGGCSNTGNPRQFRKNTDNSAVEDSGCASQWMR